MMMSSFTVLERGVEFFFEHGLEAVNLVEEEDLLVAQVGEDGGQVALNLQRLDLTSGKPTSSSLAMMVASVVCPGRAGPE